MAAALAAWWRQVEAVLHAGVANAGNKGVNRPIKLEAGNVWVLLPTASATPATNASGHAAQAQCLATDQARLISNLASLDQSSFGLENGPGRIS